MDYRARMYSPQLGRFIQPDSIIPNPVNPQAFNRFAYVLNNPIRYNGPTGHRCAGGDEDNWGYCNYKPPVPSWWKPETTSHIYIDGYGYFDTSHIGRGWRSAKWFAEQIEKQNGDGGFLPPEDANGYNAQYYVSPNVTEDEMLGVLYGIYTDYEYGFEEDQGNRLSPTRGSSFSPEDLPSDHLGFWAYMNGYKLDDIPVLLNSLGEVTVMGDSKGGSLVVDIFTDGIHIGYSYPRNYEFSPMATETIQYGVGAYATQTENVDWPSWLEIVPIPSGPNTWQKLR